jgi:hypothetical protein
LAGRRAALVKYVLLAFLMAVAKAVGPRAFRTSVGIPEAIELSEVDHD